MVCGYHAIRKDAKSTKIWEFAVWIQCLSADSGGYRSRNGLVRYAMHLLAGWEGLRERTCIV